MGHGPGRGRGEACGDVIRGHGRDPRRRGVCAGRRVVRPGTFRQRTDLTKPARDLFTSTPESGAAW